MLTKTNLFKGLIALVFVIAVTVAGLALAANSNNQVPEVAAAAPTEALIERVSAENRLDYRYAHQNSNGALASEVVVPTEIVPAESKLDYWYARQNSNGLDAAQVEQVPAESRLDFWYARQNSNGATTP